jgi:paraquat-inducible protein A
MSGPFPNAASAGLFSCHTCSLVSRQHTGRESHCPRCGSHLHFRKSNSVSRTWALAIAAAILYVPANLLPVMNTGSSFGTEADTIMSGVVVLWETGSWPLALLVFFASIMVPMAKLMALAFLLISVQRKSIWRPHERARLYRAVEFIGRWSMLDIFVVTVLVGLVQLKPLMVILPGPGAVAFAGVVVLTMFAAMTFDPRLIWDPLEKQNGRAPRSASNG